MTKVFFIIILFLVCVCSCEQSQKSPNQEAVSNINQTDEYSIYAKYSPEKIHVLPLTEFTINQDTQEGEINLFVSLLDAFNNQIKSPCTFRFELYQKIQRSSDPKGQRVMIWPDVDLNDPKINNEYWQDFFRAYEFKLSFKPQAGQSYILEVSCLSSNKKRLISEYILKSQNE